MPKNLINYSNTIFYKICCKNPNVNDVYVGYTTNLIKRKYQHKNSYENNKKIKNFEDISKLESKDENNITNYHTSNCLKLSAPIFNIIPNHKHCINIAQYLANVQQTIIRQKKKR